MAQSLSLSSAVSVFPCPNCKETINTSMQECSFCHTPIDRTAAEESAAATSKISQACSDASYLKIMAGSALTFFLIGFIPILGSVGSLGFLFLEFAIPIMTIRWWIKFGKIKTDDLEFARAKQTAMFVGIGAIIFFIAISIPKLLLL
ncbi:hypothetical protein [Tunturiibacter gelidoferens]|uniref:Uncharacterized protein n=1 Tax=Tunturiibacter gelidiferens TaxID=3069689 RepID=A0A9X0QG87_9BACT|nr:hypothetical protein [Edaphobacter lichenicola]MBB5329689.1 hypothetical protein [Edaphobacter lichenicola]